MRIQRNYLTAFLVSLLILFTIGCSTQERKVVSQWSTIWAERLETTIQVASDEQKEMRQFLEDYTSALSAGGLKKDDVILWNQEMMKARLETSRKFGRYETLREFLDYLGKGPSFYMTKLWFYRQIERVESSSDANVNAAKVFINDAQQGAKVDWADFFVNIMNQQGLIVGRKEELKILWDEYLVFANEQQAAMEEDRANNSKIALMLAVAGGAMAQYSYQQQMLNTLNRPRTCFAFRNLINCY